MHPLQLSPTTLSYLPVILLQVVCLVYLLSRPKKDTATRWLIGWLTLLCLTMCGLALAYALYHPISSDLVWLTGTYPTMAAGICFIQFAYHFPQLDRPREARLALWVSCGLITAQVGVTLFYEYEKARASDGNWLFYSFEQYQYVTVSEQFNSLINPVFVFNFLFAAGSLWAFLVWVRRLVGDNWRDFGRNLLTPATRTLRVSRNYLLIAVVSAGTIVIALSENLVGNLPPGTFPLYYICVLFLTLLVYVNDSPQPTSFMAKLGGGTFVIVLLMLSVVNQRYLSAVMSAETAMRQQLTTQSIALLNITADPPAQVAYIAARPAEGGLFSDAYTMLFSRVDAVSAEFLTAEDSLLQTGTAANSFRARATVMAQAQWLTWDDVDSTGLAAAHIPNNITAYRGALANPTNHFVRHSITIDDTLYEVGFPYSPLRATIHQSATQQAWLTLIVALGTLFLMPLFYYYSLQRPLSKVVAGVNAVEAGTLDVVVPVQTQDEIGYLARSFNNMVRSLQHENSERQRAEEQYHTLNQSLEARIQQRTHELNVLHNLSNVGTHATDIQHLLTESLTEIDKVIVPSVSAIYLQETEALNRVVGDLTQLDALAQAQDLHDWKTHPREPHLATLPEPSVHHVLFILLMAKHIPLGVLAFARNVAYTLDEVALLLLVGEQLGRALETHQLRAVAEEASLNREREEIAQRLHDTATQSLYGLNMLTEAGKAQLEGGSPQCAERTFERIGRIAQQTIKEMRLFIFQLRPPELETEGLASALQQRLDAVEGRFDVTTRLRIQTASQLPSPIQHAFYWIAQEGLNNVLRHASANHVSIRIAADATSATMVIQDDGRGFAIDAVLPSGMGLSGMRYRSTEVGGSCTWESSIGNGTTVSVTAPLKNE